jgi:hypothetical protein
MMNVNSNVIIFDGGLVYMMLLLNWGNCGGRVGPKGYREGRGRRSIVAKVG